MSATKPRILQKRPIAVKTLTAVVALVFQSLQGATPTQAAPVDAAPPLLPSAATNALPNAGTLLNNLDDRRNPSVTGSGSAVFSKDDRPVPTRPVSESSTAKPAITIILKRVTIVGNQVIGSEALAAPTARMIGKPVAMKDLTALAVSMTQLYREKGYLLAQVFLPPQDITHGEVRFDVVEGKVASIRIDAASGTPLRATDMRDWFDTLPVGQPLRQNTLESTMLRLADLPGLQVAAAIEPSRQLGEVNLLVSAEPARRWSFALTGDNYGTPAVGTNRVSAVGRLNSPFLLGDNLDFTLLGSQRLGTAYGRVAYEAPVDHSGTRAGIAYSHLNYSLGSPYRVLDAFGDAETVDVFVGRTLLRARSANVLGRATLSYRRLRDNLAAFGLYDRQSLYVADASLSYEGRDGLFYGGFSSASVKLSVARLNINSLEDRLIDSAVGGRDTAGNSVRMNASANRLMPLGGNGRQSALFAGVSGQWANRNLDNSSRITLGGPQGVRAYAPSEAVVDAGAIATVEYRIGLSNWLARVLPSAYSGVASNVTAAAFFDYGLGRYNMHAIEGQGAQTVVRSGAGVGLTWLVQPKLTVNATVAWRTTRTDSTGNDHIPRFYAQLTKVF